MGAGVTVIRSLTAPGGMLCVDLFRRADGTFGFEACRRDPEDTRGWYPVGHHAASRFESEAAALAAAREAVPWLDAVS